MPSSLNGCLSCTISVHIACLPLPINLTPSRFREYLPRADELLLSYWTGRGESVRYALRRLLLLSQSPAMLRDIQMLRDIPRPDTVRRIQLGIT